MILVMCEVKSAVRTAALLLINRRSLRGLLDDETYADETTLESRASPLAAIVKSGSSTFCFRVHSKLIFDRKGKI